MHPLPWAASQQLFAPSASATCDRCIPSPPPRTPHPLTASDSALVGSTVLPRADTLPQGVILAAAAPLQQQQRQGVGSATQQQQPLWPLQLPPWHGRNWEPLNRAP